MNERSNKKIRKSRFSIEEIINILKEVIRKKLLKIDKDVMKTIIISLKRYVVKVRSAKELLVFLKVAFIKY
ncbi:MAG TPA: hypothetical protein PLI22_04250 [Caldisericia bacterium]|nr:hypothetical protein [Caldisericia bacterium]